MNILKTHLVTFSFLTLIIGFSYSNTFDASWHFDDRPNILDNFYLHLDHLSFESVFNTLYTNPNNPYKLQSKMYRPVACLSFALNWFLGKDDVFGYHIVNILIHCVSSFFLFLFLLNVFNTPRLKNITNSKPFGIAFLATILWAVHPIQTQAVTYIVQRMALLGGMFYIMSMFAYLKGRLKDGPERFWWYSISFLFFILSFNSKENGFMLPMSLLLIEIVFFQNLSDRKTINKTIITTSIAGLLVFLSGIFIFLNQGLLSILKYEHRTFSLVERLLVEPRVLIFHFSQIFFPLPGRFSIAHDFILSPSFFVPRTTIPCMLVIFALICFGIFEMRRSPLICFAILFFFVNHVIESSILPLEIVFEHRNYLPSMFLFLPFAFWANNLLALYYSQKKTFRYSLVTFCLLAIIVGFSVSTYTRNKVWKNDVLLWGDAFNKAPNNARAANILALRLAWGDHSQHPNRYDMAIELFKKSLTMHIPSKSFKADILANMAAVYSNNKRDYRKAIALFQEALEINPGNSKIRLDMVRSFVLWGHYNEALDQLEFLISKNDPNWIFYNMKGFILLWQENYRKAFTNFQSALRLFSQKKEIAPKDLLLNMGVALCLMGENNLSEEVLKDLNHRDPNDLSTYCALIENSLRSENQKKAREYFSQMLLRFNTDVVLEYLDFRIDHRGFPPLAHNIIKSFIMEIDQERKRVSDKLQQK